MIENNATSFFFLGAQQQRYENALVCQIVNLLVLESSIVERWAVLHITKKLADTYNSVAPPQLQLVKPGDRFRLVENGRKGFSAGASSWVLDIFNKQAQ